MARPSLSGKDSLGSDTLWGGDESSGTLGSEEPSGFQPTEDTRGTESERLERTTLFSAADIVPKRVQWMWKGRIPLGKVTVIDGRPGLGKSSMLLDITARATRGREMPDGFDPTTGPCNVLIVTAEDDWEDTVVPRLMAAEADLTRVFRLDDLVIPDGVLGLENRILEVKAALVIIDPLVAFVVGKFNLYRDQDARAVRRGEPVKPELRVKYGVVKGLPFVPKFKSVAPQSLFVRALHQPGNVSGIDHLPGATSQSQAKMYIEAMRSDRKEGDREIERVLAVAIATG